MDKFLDFMKYNIGSCLIVVIIITMVVSMICGMKIGYAVGSKRVGIDFPTK